MNWAGSVNSRAFHSPNGTRPWIRPRSVLGVANGGGADQVVATELERQVAMVRHVNQFDTFFAARLALH